MGEGDQVREDQAGVRRATAKLFRVNVSAAERSEAAARSLCPILLLRFESKERSAEFERAKIMERMTRGRLHPLRRELDQ